MINGSVQYATAAAFRRAVEDRLKHEARLRDRSLEELRREFLFQRFLALVFADSGENWLLKGGGGLLMRLPDARFSKDLDLLRLGSIDPDDAVTELRELTRPRDGDHLTYVIADGVARSSVNPVVEIKVTAYVGAKYGNFPIDLAHELHMVAAPERVRPVPVVAVPGLAGLPEVVVYPLVDQVADKICAMYELHGEAPSTRYRDLLDLALIVSTCDLEGPLLAEALASESRRRRLRLPDRIESPGLGWRAGYSAAARSSRLPARLHDFAAALALVGACVDPVLAGGSDLGSWSPARGWTG